jgi:uncharacterized protein (TIRG00374 family)
VLAESGRTTPPRRPTVPGASRRRLLIAVALITSGLVAVRVLIDSRDELIAAADDLTRLRPAWLLAAVAAEVISYISYAWAQRSLLRGGGGVEVSVAPMTAMAVSGQAAANCLPGGVAISAGVTYRLLSRRGVDAGLCGWMLTVTTMLYASALAVLALIGAQIAGSSSDAVPDLRLPSAALLMVMVLAGGGLYLVRHRRLAMSALSWLAHHVDGAVARRRGDPDDGCGAAARFVDHVSSIRAGSRVLAAAALLLVVCWAADGMCLALSFFALGDSPPWTGLLLAYCAAQLAAMIPFTPGGLGVVEGSLTVALVAFGGAAQAALSAVLLYRLISFWGLLPGGAACYVGLRITDRRRATLRQPQTQAAAV